MFVHRTLDIKEKKHRVPEVDRTPVEPPPIIVAIVGPPKVGKTTLLKGLIRNYTSKKLSEINGPVTVVSGEPIFVNIFFNTWFSHCKFYYTPVVVLVDMNFEMTRMPVFFILYLFLYFFI